MKKISIILCIFYYTQASNICIKGSKECNYLNSKNYDEEIHLIFKNLTIGLIDEISDLNDELFELVKFLINDSSNNIKELDEFNKMVILYGQNNKIIINKIAKKYRKIQLLIEDYEKNKYWYFFKVNLFDSSYMSYIVDFIFYLSLFFKNKYLFVIIILLQFCIKINIFGIFVLKICLIFLLCFKSKKHKKYK